MANLNNLEAGRRAVSVEEAAIQLGIGRSLAYELVKEGKLRSVRAGHRVLVSVAALEEFLSGESSADNSLA